MDIADVQWNEQARDKILTDSDRVLQEAVREVAASDAASSSDAAFAELIKRLEGRFIDFEPGPDIRRYADAIAAGEFAGA
jgi:hypothetical protein